MLDVRIDRSSVSPLHRQLATALVEGIEGGRWGAGERLPSESELCDAFGLSRTTVRRALSELERQGLLRREKGRGTFVAQPGASSEFLQSAEGFFDEVSRTGRRVHSRVLRLAAEPLAPWAALALGLPLGSGAVTLERLRLVDEEVVMYAVTHIPEDLAAGLSPDALADASLYATLAAMNGVVVAGGRRTVEAVAASDEVARRLELLPGQPVLYLEAVSWDADRRPVEAYRAWTRSDRSRLEVQVAGAAAG